MKNIRSMVRTVVVIAACTAAGAALAQAPGRWQGPAGGPGYGPADGRGPGMMQGPGMMHGPGAGAGAMRDRGEFMARALGLTEEQRAKMRQIREDTRRKNWDALGQIRTERFKLGEMMRGDTVDPNAAVEQKRRIDDLKRQVMHVRLEARNQALALLTPEQREKARAFRQHRGGRRNG